jgi:hypothetical protein
MLAHVAFFGVTFYVLKLHIEKLYFFFTATKRFVFPLRLDALGFRGFGFYGSLFSSLANINDCRASLIEVIQNYC